MKLIRQDVRLARPHPARGVFEGEVVSQDLVTDDDAELLRVTAITFRDGARNKPHRHTTEQVLIVTDGRGIVAGADQEFHVGPGDVILIPAGERHWHGAEPGADFTHLSVLTPGEMTLAEP